MLKIENLKIGGRYNWKRQKERLVYKGKQGSRHQFAKVDDLGTVWCEVLDEDLHMLEETADRLYSAEADEHANKR